jgi:hypothetical protein
MRPIICTFVRLCVRALRKCNACFKEMQSISLRKSTSISLTNAQSHNQTNIGRHQPPTDIET